MVYAPRSRLNASDISVRLRGPLSSTRAQEYDPCPGDEAPRAQRRSPSGEVTYGFLRSRCPCSLLIKPGLLTPRGTARAALIPVVERRSVPTQEGWTVRCASRGSEILEVQGRPRTISVQDSPPTDVFTSRRRSRINVPGCPGEDDPDRVIEQALTLRLPLPVGKSQIKLRRQASGFSWSNRRPDECFP